MQWVNGETNYGTSAIKKYQPTDMHNSLDESPKKYVQ
jgi:hypothetical protein